MLNHPRPDELLSRLFHFLPVLLLLPLIIRKSSVAADLSCFYIKHNTHMETDGFFFMPAIPRFFSCPPPLFHPTNPTRLYPGKGRDNEKLGRAPGAAAAPAPVLVLVLLSFALRPPAWLLTSCLHHVAFPPDVPQRRVQSRSLGRQLSSAPNIAVPPPSEWTYQAPGANQGWIS